MDAEILSIGTELLMGELVDTNAPYLAARMPAMGLTVRAISQVGDNLDDLTQALSRAWQRAQVVVTTGGLGPTQDDLTREAIARLLGEELQLDEALVEGLRAMLAARGRPLVPSNLKQAYRIPSAVALPNAQGTAPGWWVERGGRVIVALPGPPGEMQGMWEQEVLPRLRLRSLGPVLVTRTLKTIGLPEAEVDHMIPGLFGRENPYLGIYAKPDGIHLRLIARGATREEALQLIAPVEEEIRRALGPYIWGVDDETPENRLGDILRRGRLTLATMESLTGGLIASTITEVPGSSEYFKGGFVAYSNAVKIALGVPAALIEAHGAVSPQVAQAMAESARLRGDADIGLATTGVAGPDPLEGKSPGTAFIGISVRGETHSVEGRYPPRRTLVKQRAALHALLELCHSLTRQGSERAMP